MKQILTQISLVTLFATVFVLGLVSHVQAGDCTNANFEGSFGYSGTGTIISGPNAGPIAFAGRLTADGKGTFVGGDTVSINGRIVRRTYTAEYKVNEDCTGSYEADTSLGVVHANFVIVNHGEELRNIRTDEGQVLTFSLKKQHVKDCTQASFEGNYGYSGNGLIITGPNRGPVAFVGLLTPDGKGYFSGSDTLSVNGRILSRTYEANYKVNKDCTGSYEAETSLGQVHSDFVLVGDGEEAHVIRTDEGQVLTFSFKKQ
jgi:hypothetical protein